MLSIGARQLPFALIVLLPCVIAAAEAAIPGEPTPTRGKRVPTIFIAGDSTAAQGAGWGTSLPKYFRSNKVVVSNRAQGGASSRTFLTSGLWAQVASELRAGDVVLIQFGHNDSSPINDEPPPPLRARGSLPGIGDDQKEIDNKVTNRRETVHTYGWYLSRMIHDAIGKEATPVILGMTVRNVWHHGHVERGLPHYATWAKAVAAREEVPFFDATDFMADSLERIGSAAAAGLYPNDTTHFGSTVRDQYAAAIVAALRRLECARTEPWLSEAGKQLPTMSDKYLFWNHRKVQ